MEYFRTKAFLLTVIVMTGFYVAYTNLAKTPVVELVDSGLLIVDTPAPVRPNADEGVRAPVLPPQAYSLQPKASAPMEFPKTFYTIDRATERTANGVKAIPKGTRVNVLEAECGFVAISDGRTVVVVSERVVSSDLEVINKALR